LHSFFLLLNHGFSTAPRPKTICDDCCNPALELGFRLESQGMKRCFGW